MKKFIKRPVLAAKSHDRAALIDQCDALYAKYSTSRYAEQVERIINKHNASQNDSGPEGFFATMSNDDIRAAIAEISAIETRQEQEITLKIKLEKRNPALTGDFEFQVDTNDVGELVLTPYDSNVRFVSGELVYEGD